MTHQQLFKMLKLFTVCSALLLIGAMFGCSDGSNGTSSGTVSGTVTDTAGNKLASITVTPAPAVQGLATVSTGTGGNYSMTIPNGNFTLTFAKAGYTSQSLAVSVVSGQTTTLNVQMVQTAAAVVNVANANFANGTATLSATALVNDPALQGQPATFEWKDAAGNVIGTGATITVPQPTSAQYKAVLAEEVRPLRLIAPAGTFIDPVDGELNAFRAIRQFETLARMMVVGIPQEAFEKAAVTPFTVTATIAGQTFNASPTVSVASNTLPFVPNPGLRNVPVGQPVMLQGSQLTGDDPENPAVQAARNWTITAPTGSAVTALVDPTTRFPNFVPDVVGTYTVTETISGGTMNIHVGKYVGILQPAADNNPLGQIDVGCSQAGCHVGNPVFNSDINAKFAEWNLSGHREIMVQAMGGTHYSLDSCARCHSIGWSYASATVSAGGFNDIAAASSFTDASFQANAPNFFTGFNQVLKVSEVQCEACHGPNDSAAHNSGAPANAIAANNDAVTARVSYSADVCAPCHGEPLRHGRYQEWLQSGHANYEVAIGEGLDTDGVGPNVNCAGCHSAQGFTQFIQQLQAGDPRRALNATSQARLANLTADNVQPQTCITCHTPHNAGKQSGLVGAIVVLRGDYQSGGAFDGITPLLPSGFQANGVGRGALCITCHNSRNGGSGTTALLHEDGVGNFPALTAYSAPHEACQGDVLMGRNAYFFGTGQVGQRGSHSILADACVTCHLQKTPADPSLGYPANVSGAGTNHSFGIITNPNLTANEQINALCAQCHGSAFDGTGVQKSFTASNNVLLTAAANATLRLKFGSTAAIPAGTTLTFIPGRTPQVSLNGAAAVNLATFLTGAPGTGTATGTVTATGFNLQLAKSNWNAALVGEDNSRAVHNPNFANSVITATINALNAI